MLLFKKSANPYYPDIPLFLILIPFISAINYYLTYSNIRLNGFLLLTFSIDTVQGYLAWWGVRALIIFLDKKLPFRKNAVRRISLQLVSTTLTGLLIISALTELVSWIARGRPAPLHFYTLDLVIIGIWFIVVNGIYIGLHYFNAWQRAEADRASEKRARTAGFVLKHGKKDMRLKFADLAGFYVEGTYVIACSTSGKKFILERSLDKIDASLPHAFFFRLNRQYLLHRQMISGFRRVENGKIFVLIIDHEAFPREIPVSRTKAPAFKNWFRPD